MKIAIVNKHRQDKLGGSEIQCDIIARKLVVFGHNVVYIAVGGSGEYQSEYSVIPVKDNIQGIKKGIQRAAPDIVYWRFNKHFFYKSVQYIKSKKIPVVFAVSHIHDLEKWGAKAVSKEKPIWKRLAITIIRSFESRKQHRGFPLVDGLVVNNKEFLKKSGHSNTRFIQSSSEVETVPFTHDKPYLVWISSLKPSKRPEVCLKLAQRIDNLNVDLLMFGEIQKDVYEYFRNHDLLPDNIKYMGKKPLKVVNGAIKHSIALLHTGEPEGFANTFMQAWMLGKPVISYSYNPDSLLDGDQFGICAENDFEVFVSSVQKMVIDPGIRKTLADNTQKFANEQFSPERNVGQLEKFFEEILAKRKEDL